MFRDKSESFITKTVIYRLRKYISYIMEVPLVLWMMFSEKETLPTNTRNSSGFEAKNMRTVHCGSETIAYLGPKILDLVPRKMKDSEDIDIFKSNSKLWKPLWNSGNCSCRLCKLDLLQTRFFFESTSLFVLINFIVYMQLFFLYEIFISMFVFIQIQVVTAFATVVHFMIWIKIKKANVARPYKEIWMHKLW